jgi:hypothetical protein
MNIGAQSGLVDPIHEELMGTAVWLYLWFVWRQTRRSGLVLGGMPFTYEIIAERSGFSVRKIRRWTEVLKVGGYIEVQYTNYKHMRIRVLKSKKFNFKQMGLPLEEEKTQTEPLRVVEKPVEKIAQHTKNGQWVIPKTGNGSTKNGQFNKSVMLSSNETPEAEVQATAAAFTAIGYDQPFGQKPFQEIWVRRYKEKSGEWLTEAMEATIQECQQRIIGVPPQFYKCKHEIEKYEEALFMSKRKAPL